MIARLLIVGWLVPEVMETIDLCVLVVMVLTAPLDYGSDQERPTFLDEVNLRKHNISKPLDTIESEQHPEKDPLFAHETDVSQPVQQYGTSQSKILDESEDESEDESDEGSIDMSGSDVNDYINKRYFDDLLSITFPKNPNTNLHKIVKKDGVNDFWDFQQNTKEKQNFNQEQIDSPQSKLWDESEDESDEGSIDMSGSDENYYINKRYFDDLLSTTFPKNPNSNLHKIVKKDGAYHYWDIQQNTKEKQNFNQEQNDSPDYKKVGNANEDVDNLNSGNLDFAVLSSTYDQKQQQIYDYVDPDSWTNSESDGETDGDLIDMPGRDVNYNINKYYFDDLLSTTLPKDPNSNLDRIVKKDLSFANFNFQNNIKETEKVNHNGSPGLKEVNKDDDGFDDVRTISETDSKPGPDVTNIPEDELNYKDDKHYLDNLLSIVFRNNQYNNVNKLEKESKTYGYLDFQQTAKEKQNFNQEHNESPDDEKSNYQTHHKNRDDKNVDNNGDSDVDDKDVDDDDDDDCGDDEDDDDEDDDENEDDENKIINQTEISDGNTNYEDQCYDFEDQFSDYEEEYNGYDDENDQNEDEDIDEENFYIITQYIKDFLSRQDYKYSIEQSQHGFQENEPFVNPGSTNNERPENGYINKLRDIIDYTPTDDSVSKLKELVLGHMFTYIKSIKQDGNNFDFDKSKDMKNMDEDQNVDKENKYVNHNLTEIFPKYEMNDSSKIKSYQKQEEEPRMYSDSWSNTQSENDNTDIGKAGYAIHSKSRDGTNLMMNKLFLEDVFSKAFPFNLHVYSNKPLKEAMNEFDTSTDKLNSKDLGQDDVNCISNFLDKLQSNSHDIPSAKKDNFDLKKILGHHSEKCNPYSHDVPQQYENTEHSLSGSEGEYTPDMKSDSIVEISFSEKYSEANDEEHNPSLPDVHNEELYSKDTGRLPFNSQNNYKIIRDNKMRSSDNHVSVGVPQNKFQSPKGNIDFQVIGIKNGKNSKKSQNSKSLDHDTESEDDTTNQSQPWDKTGETDGIMFSNQQSSSQRPMHKLVGAHEPASSKLNQGMPPETKNN